MEPFDLNKSQPVVNHIYLTKIHSERTLCKIQWWNGNRLNESELMNELQIALVITHDLTKCGQKN
jgi:hypothetical protein